MTDDPRICARCARDRHNWCPGWQSGDGESACECPCRVATSKRKHAVVYRRATGWTQTEGGKR